MKRFSDMIFPVIILIFLTLFTPRALSAEGYIYYTKGRRDPFIPLVLGGRRAYLGLEAVEMLDDVKLEGIVFDPFGKSMAMLNGEIVEEGKRIHNIEIIKIHDDAIIIKIYAKTYTISLAEEGGQVN